MKTVEIHDPHGDLARCVEQAREERVVITRSGKPAAVITNVEGYDLDAIETAADPEFWEMIEQRRQQPTLSRAELEHGTAI